jgi:two-component system response regulator QseB
VARRLLILEDDALLAKQLRRLFTSRGYDVHAVGSVGEFQEMAASGRYDALLLDLSLPDGNGLDAWSTARTTQDGAIAVLMTAYGTDDVERRAERLGINTLLPKPLDVQMLLAAIDGVPAPSRGRA